MRIIKAQVVDFGVLVNNSCFLELKLKQSLHHKYPKGGVLWNYYVIVIPNGIECNYNVFYVLVACNISIHCGKGGGGGMILFTRS